MYSKHNEINRIPLSYFHLDGSSKEETSTDRETS